MTLGGTVGHSEIGEYGQAILKRQGESQLLDGTPEQQQVWMSHRDAVSAIPEGFTVTASTDVCPVAAMECAERRIYTTQFHPEVKHSPFGQSMLSNFLFNIAGLEANWTMDTIIEDSVAAIQEQVGDKRVILGLSGGVDSSVVAALCSKAIGNQLTCVFVNHGLLRKNEPEEVEEVFSKQFDCEFIHVHAEERYAALLAEVTDPEEKRRIIGTQFWNEFFAVAQDIAEDGRPVQFMAQGTIYPDIIESGARKTGGKASTIKSHHNLIPFPEGVHFDLIEPLDHFFKDEVRALGSALGLPDHIVHRQPFPGPGLAIRVIGAVDPEKVAIVRESDAILREEFAKSGMDAKVWQYFTIVPDIRTTGVVDGKRTELWPVIIRAVNTTDAMTASVPRLDWELLETVTRRVQAEVPGVSRVLYDLSPKPPATIEWE